MLSALVDGPPSCYLTHSPVLTAAPPANLCGRICGYASLSAVSRLNEAGASTGIQGGILQQKKKKKERKKDENHCLQEERERFDQDLLTENT